MVDQLPVPIPTCVRARQITPPPHATPELISVLSLCFRLFVRFLQTFSTFLEAHLGTDLSAEKVHNFPSFWRKPAGPFVLQIEARFSCWQSFCPLLGGSLVSQPKPPCNRVHVHRHTHAHTVTHTADGRKTRDKLPESRGQEQGLLCCHVSAAQGGPPTSCGGIVGLSYLILH